METLREEINEQLKSGKRLSNYGYIKTLILYWEHADNTGFQAEGNDLGRVFRDVFGYEVAFFAIPSTSSQLRVDSLISQMILDAEDGARRTVSSALLIIYYGGHGDPNDDRHNGEEKRSVWAARSDGGPTVEWFQIQSKFAHTNIDTLVILDCCFGAQAGRAPTLLPQRVELLTAAGMGVQTPLPGPRSFTASLIREMQSCLTERGYVLTSELHSRLVDRRAGLFTTPFHVKLRHNDFDRSIRLEPVNPDKIADDHGLTGSLLRLAISTVQPVDQRSAKEISTWLSSDVPRSIFALQVDEVLHNTANICATVENKARRHQLEAINESAQEEFVAEWQRIRNSLEVYMSYETRPFDTDEIAKRSDTVQDILRRAAVLPRMLMERVYQNILKSAAGDNDLLDTLLRHPSAISSELEECLQLCQMAHSSVQCGETLYQHTEPDPIKGNDFIYEYRPYGASIPEADIEDAMHRVGLLADLLHASKSKSFLSLKCVNWRHEPADHRFVLVFEKPLKYCTDKWKQTNLQNVIAQVKGPKRPSLGQRFQIALQLSKALAKWHSVGWVHQGISSKNVILFTSEPEGPLDYPQPFLGGFESSRPSQVLSGWRGVQDVASDVYRHPARQGKARESHRKAHDIYSLGVVLLELGLWQRAVDVISMRSKSKPTSEVIRQDLLHNASERLAHYAGTTYQKVVLRCLNGQFDVELDDRAETHLANAFQSKVIGQLEQISRFL